MSYIEKERLIKQDLAGIENKVRHAFNQGYDLGFKEGKQSKTPGNPKIVQDYGNTMAIKTLEFLKDRIESQMNTEQSGDEVNIYFIYGIIDKYISDLERAYKDEEEN